MCGISGLVRPEVLSPEDVEAVERMTAAMHHRVSDSDGFLLAPSVALGMRRLECLSG